MPETLIFGQQFFVYNLTKDEYQFPQYVKFMP